MLKKITLTLVYDGTSQGDIDRDAFKSVLDSEVLKDTVVPEVYHGSHLETSSTGINEDTVTATIFYVPTNAGISDFNAFWGTLETEFSKSTVVKTNNISNGNKHNCNHDSVGSCSNFVNLTD